MSYPPPSSQHLHSIFWLRPLISVHCFLLSCRLFSVPVLTWPVFHRGLCQFSIIYFTDVELECFRLFCCCWTVCLLFAAKDWLYWLRQTGWDCATVPTSTHHCWHNGICTTARLQTVSWSKHALLAMCVCVCVCVLKKLLHDCCA